MPSNYTQNYQLSQWEPGDQVLRTDFNADNAKIDGAIASKSQVAMGSYTIQNGTAYEPHHIAVGFRPKAVLIWKNMVTTSSQSSCTHSALFLDGHPIVAEGTKVIAQVVDDGFIVQQHDGGGGPYHPYISNSSTYLYIAFS